MAAALPPYFQIHHPRDHNVLPKSMRYLALQRILPAGNAFRLNRSKIFRAVANSNSCALEISMADKTEKKDESQSVSGESSILNGRKEEGEKESEKSTPSKIPPPPEKPLPDDCCGSGCVRCVWDIYYDELEEYNKLYKNN